MKKDKAKNNETIKLSFSERFHRYMKLLWKQRVLIALIIPAVAVVIIFKYFPMYGIMIAFKNYKPKAGITGSPWLDPLFKNFIRFFRNTNSWPTIWNTLKVGVMTMIFTFPAPIIFALLLNEVRGKIFKRSVQTISYIPHFISIVVICSMLNGFGSLDGLFNIIREFFGMEAVDMNNGSAYFLAEYIGSAIWQGIGWGSIIYLSALSNVDTSLYDVANIDGANRWQKIKAIAWPAILPTTTVLLIMNVGNVMGADFTKILLMQNDTNRSQLEVISTFVYHQGIEQGNFEYSTAVNLFVSVVCFILVFGTNLIVRRIDSENSLW